MKPYENIAEAIADIGRIYPENGFVFQDWRGRETEYRFSEVEEDSRRRAAALQGIGLRKGDRMGLLVSEPEDFVLTFLAAVQIGVIPVPLSPPFALGGLDTYLQETTRILTDSDASHLVISPSLTSLLGDSADLFLGPWASLSPAALRNGGNTPDLPTLAPDDVVFLQYTSGATSHSKGVMVTHAALMANIQAMCGPGLELDPRVDIAVSWLPLYHDMGLIGFVIAPMVWGMSSVIIPTMRFMKNPSVWLDTMHRRGGTISFAPPFAFGLAVRRARADKLATWDLSGVRIMGCGSEPIHPRTLRTFVDLFHKHCGLPENAALPAYGLAEATLAVSFKPLRQRYRTRKVDAEHFHTARTAIAPSDNGLEIEHVSCGVPFPGHELAILDEEAIPVPDGEEGEICVRGASVTPGYFRNPAATAASYRDGWLHTGDLGYVLDSQLYVTGRLKDLVILNGRNIHPQLIEWAAGDVAGVRKRNIIAFSRPGDSTEELVVAVETRLENPKALIREIKRAVWGKLGVMTSDVVCVKPGTLPKTSSGKLRRRLTRRRYTAGQLDRKGPAALGDTSSRGPERANLESAPDLGPHG